MMTLSQSPDWTHTLHGRNLEMFLLRVIPPSLVLLSTLALIPLRPTHTAQGSDVTVVVAATRTPRRGAILSLLVLLSGTYFLDGALSVIFAVLQGTPLRPADVASPIGLLAFAGLAAMGSYKDVLGISVWETKRVKLGLTAAFVVGTAHTAYLVHTLSGYGRINTFTLAHLAFVVSRGLFLIPLLVAVARPRITYASVLTDEEPGPSTDTSLLLPAPTAIAPSTGLSALAAKDGNGAQYGTFASRPGRAALAAPSGPTTRANTPVPSTKGAAPVKDEISLDPTWSETVQRLKRITPYLWPSKSKALQLLAVACFGILIIGRIVNWALPLSLKALIQSLQYGTGKPWFYLSAYVILRYLQSSGGLGAIRDLLWTPVMQYSDRAMSQLSFDHLLNLSLAFHTHRKTGEILRILDRGAAINRIFELLLFNLVPIVADIVIALVMFVIYFEWTLAFVIGLDMATYMAASVLLTQWRTKLRRQMNDRDVITRGIHTDCLLNYETVKYFNGERHEAARYADAIRQYQALEFRVITSLNMLNLIQNLILCFGLLVGSMIVALRVTHGQGDASDFVLFITYISQLYGPLQMLGSIYRSINQGLVDTEKLLKLLNEPTDIIDSAGAPDLQISNGQIEFDNVSFSYDGRATALSGVSFTVPKGASVALVGESGAGKSTILRLLYRFYDLGPGQGAIRIDGQDIRDVSQDSLRRAIGVVPQDSVLFNASISYNIGYGRVGEADQEAIQNAAKAAQMHDRILGFPDGYETKVGERGVRLSGGEKQRVAIARTVLKDPPVLLLDEATSALDTGTERDIQRALQALAKGRSSLWIAHRLSTIASADLILVLKDGAVAEQGTHSELLAKNGIFAAMWAEQVAGSDASSSGGDADAGDNTGDIKEPIVVSPEVDPEAVGYFVEDPQAVSEPSAPGPAEEDAAVAEVESVIPPPSVQVQESEGLEAPSVAPMFSDSPSMLTQESSAPAPDAEIAPAETEQAEETAAAPAGPVAFPKSDDEDEYEAPAPAAPAPVAFPKSDDEDDDAAAPPPSAPAAPMAFPESDDEEDAIPAPQPIDAAPALSFPTATATSDDATAPSEAGVVDSSAQSPAPAGVTFSPDAASSRDGTPGAGPDEPKRKRISSQNFQRLARRISLSGKRQNSAGQAIANMIPGLRRNEASREASEASAATVPSSPPPPGMTGSPSPSVRQSEDNGSMTSPGKLSKKDKSKKEKRKTTLL